MEKGSQDSSSEDTIPCSWGNSAIQAYAYCTQDITVSDNELCSEKQQRTRHVGDQTAYTEVKLGRKPEVSTGYSLALFSFCKHIAKPQKP